MCKFKSSLFTLLILASLEFSVYVASQTNTRSLVDLLLFGDDYDVRYDQRQKGGLNVRVHLDGFLIGLPENSAGLYITNDELLNALGIDDLLNGNESSLDILQNFKSDNAQKKSNPLTEKSTEVNKENNQPTTQKAVVVGKRDLKEPSRTKVLLVNLLDFITRKRRS